MFDSAACKSLGVQGIQVFRVSARISAFSSLRPLPERATVQMGAAASDAQSRKETVIQGRLLRGFTLLQAWYNLKDPALLASLLLAEARVSSWRLAARYFLLREHSTINHKERLLNRRFTCRSWNTRCKHYDQRNCGSWVFSLSGTAQALPAKLLANQTLQRAKSASTCWIKFPTTCFSATRFR